MKLLHWAKLNSMNSETKDRSNILFGELRGVLCEYDKRMDDLLKKVDEGIAGNYVSFTGKIATLMVAAAVALVWFDKSIIFASVIAVMGGFFFVVALSLRHFSENNRLANMRIIADMEKEKMQSASREKILTHLWLHGHPKGIDVNLNQILLSEQQSTTTHLPPGSTASHDTKLTDNINP